MINMVPNIAGADFGSTHAKFVWFKVTEDPDEMYPYTELKKRSTLDTPKADILEEMAADSITDVYCIGIQAAKEDVNVYALAGINLHLLPEDRDPITIEKRFTANGARYLFRTLPNFFLLASVGTGVSYSYVLPGDIVVPLPVGSALGGGFINGLRSLLTLKWDDLAETDGEPLDLFVRDYLPEHPNKDFVLAHLGKADKARSKYSKKDLAASVLHCVAATLAKDFKTLGFLTKNVVVTGSVVQLEPLQNMLLNFQDLIGKNIYFGSEFSGAMGALEAGENSIGK